MVIFVSLLYFVMLYYNKLVFFESTMNLKPTLLSFCVSSLLPCTVVSAWADDEPLPSVVNLGVLTATVDTAFLVDKPVVVKKEALSQRSATLGNALAGELGVHSNPFGGGASAPVVRGQEGVRVAILQNGTDVIDVSSMSPDHVVAADTLLASRVDLVRGAGTLLYSNASPAGVINVVDKRIPDKMPQGLVYDKVEGDALLRYNSANHEKVAAAGVTLWLGERVAVRVEGLKRGAGEYKVPHFQAEKTVLDYLPGSQNKSTVGTIGASYIADQGYIGASYSRRQDNYHIPGHIHCASNKEHFINWYGSGRYYVPVYPHLMGDEDISDFPHTHCRHSHNEPSVNNPTGVLVNHEHDTPWIQMKSDRYDIRGRYRPAIKGIDKAEMSLTYANYYHDERDPGNEQDPNNYKPANRGTSVDKGSIGTLFNKKGVNGRFELYHTPSQRLSGVVGVQYQTQKASAGELVLPSYFESPEAYERALRGNVNQYKPYLLVPHTNKGLSVFALEKIKLTDKFTAEIAGRYEQQKTPVHYRQFLLDHAYDKLTKDPAMPKVHKAVHPDLSTYRQNALSYSLAGNWQVSPHKVLTLTYSHNERIPSPMELYYQGRHLATSSFEHGNKDLKKEQSDNYELSFKHTSDKLDYKASAYYNDFDNYIFNENIAKEGNLYLRRYNQTTAKIYGFEGEATYYFSPSQRITLFGDVVRGKLGALSDVVGKNFYDKDPQFDEDNIDTACLLAGGDLSKCLVFTNNPVAPPKVELDPACGVDDIKDAPDICVITYPAILSVDTLKRPATNVPRIPPARLGLRWGSDFGERWSVNGELTRVFGQNKTSTATIAIRPDLRTPTGCEPSQPDCKILSYYGNNLPMQPRYVTENKTQGYTLLNLGVDYKNAYKGLDYTVSLRANNLLNQQIYIHNSFLPFVPQMGRNFSLALSTTF